MQDEVREGEGKSETSASQTLALQALFVHWLKVIFSFIYK